MTEREIEQIVARWQRRMGLERWRISVDFVTPSEECGDDLWSDASIWRSNTYETARIHLNPKWREWSAAEAEDHLVHELVHLWTRDVEQVLKLVEQEVTYSVYKMIEAAFSDRNEQAVDVISRRLIAIASEAS